MRETVSFIISQTVNGTAGKAEPLHYRRHLSLSAVHVALSRLEDRPVKILVAVLTLTAMLAAQNKPCLIVQTLKAEPGPLGIPSPERFPYLESQNLPMRDVKDQYKRKELEKLESKGVKIIVTNGSQRRGRATIQVTTQNSEGLDDDLARARRACQEGTNK